MPEENEKEENGPGFNIILLLGIIIAIVIIAFTSSAFWKTNVIVKAIFFTIIFLPAWLIATAVAGKAKGLGLLIGILIGILIGLIAVMAINSANPTFYGDLEARAATVTTAYKSGWSQGWSQLKCAFNPECVAGQQQKQPKLTTIQLNFPQTIYHSEKPFSMRENLTVINPYEEEINLTPQCYLGSKDSPIDTTIFNNKKSALFKQSTITKTAPIYCNDSTATKETVSGKNLIIEIERTTKVTLNSNISVSPESLAGTKEQITYTIKPDSEVLPYLVSLDLPGNQPFSEGQDFRIIFKKQKDFDLKRIDSIKITSLLPVSCENFIQSDKEKSVIQIQNIDIQELLKNYATEKDTFSFNCNFMIVEELKSESSKPIQIDINYTTTKDFSTALSVAQ